MKQIVLQSILTIGALTNHTVYAKLDMTLDKTINAESSTKLNTNPNTKSTKQPNILLIIADDLGTEALSIYNQGGAKTTNTPNIDSLAQKGIIFNNVWGAPSSSPSRACMLTGRYGFRTDIIDVRSNLSTDETSIQQYIRDNNPSYTNSIIGKWHLSKEVDSPANFGVDYYAGFMGGGVGDYNSWELTINGHTQHQTSYITTKLTDLAIEWIDKQSEQEASESHEMQHLQDKPWFCWLAYSSPHTPLHRPPTYMHTQGELPTNPDSIKANPLPYFLAMVESLDYEIGRLLREIAPWELKNTVIIFIGDNGTDRAVIQEPYSARHSKGTLYEGGIRVPMVASGAGVTRNGEHDNKLICSTDIFATIAELAGVTQPTYHDSFSFKPLLETSQKGERKFSFSELLSRKHGYCNTIRNQQYKLISIKTQGDMLFDLINDPAEEINLLDQGLTSEQQQAYKELQKELTSLNIPAAITDKKQTNKGKKRR